MPTRVSLYPYKMGSQSAIHLADTLGIRRVREQGRYRWRIGHKIINWGNSRLANWMTPVAMPHVINKPINVELASNKLRTFIRLQEAGVPIPDVTTLPGQEGAAGWLRAEPKYPGKKHAVLCRTLTRANSGRGIVMATTPEEVVPAPLYTRYVPKVDEYRVHVFKDLGVIDVQQKRRNSDVPAEERNSYIRNHTQGWVFCRGNLQVPQVVTQAAINSVLALGLDFGAVDLGHHPAIGVCVYEVNTAPGLEGQTLVKYATAIQQLLGM